MAAFFGGGGRKTTTAQEPKAAAGLRFQTSVFGGGIPTVYGQNRIAGNLIWYGDFVATPHAGGQRSGKGGGGGSQPQPTSFTYTASVALGLCEGPIDGVNAYWADKQQGSLNASSFNLFLGTYPQTPWGYLTTQHPGQNLAYAGLAYVAAAGYALNDSAELPNHTFEIEGRFRYNAAAGLIDANPSDVVGDILTNVNYGVGFPAGAIGDLSAYSNYCVTGGLLLSPVIDAQRTAHDILDELATATNAAFVWSGGVLKLTPYGDQAASGSGATAGITFTPNLTPLYDLADDDFQSASGGDPVRCTRTTPADAFNQVQVEFANRANQYNPEIAEAKDQAAIEAYGLRPNPPLKLHAITNPAVARLVAQLVLQRALYVRNTYDFQLGWRHCLLEPMDLVTLTDINLGLNRQLVRITEIDEDEQGLLSVKAEEVAVGSASAALYNPAVGIGYQANYNTPPGNVNPPIIFDAPVELAASGLEVWCAVSGGVNWGGADVWLSTDGNTFAFAGRSNGGARMGVLNAPLALGADPDTANTLGVDLSMSRGALLSGTQADADLYRTLCYVDGELLSYETATLTAVNAYNLSHLRRGAYGTAIAAHATGSGIARIDQAIFKLPYTKAEIGKTILVKFASFNIYGGGAQDIASLSAFTHTIAGPPPPPAVTGFSVQQNGNVVSFQWNQIVNDFALKGYDIAYGPQGTSNWSAMLLLTEALRGTEMTNASVPPGNWTFGIRARDLADQLSPQMTTADLAVTLNSQQVIYQSQQAPAWLGLGQGTSTAYVQHWTGVLVPENSKTPAQYADFTPFDQFVPDPVASSIYEAPLIDVGFTDSFRFYGAPVSVPGPGTTGSAGAQLQIDAWAAGASDTGLFQNWAPGNLTARFVRVRFVAVPGTSPAYITGFAPTADEPVRQDGGTVSIAAGGGFVAFNRQFHNPPQVQITVQGASALYATANGIAANGFTAHVFNPAGSDVGGNVFWQATGT